MKCHKVMDQKNETEGNPRDAGAELLRAASL